MAAVSRKMYSARGHSEVSALLVTLALLFSVTGCNGDADPTEFAMIEQPSAVVHYKWATPAHPDNEAAYQVGAMSGSSLTSMQAYYALSANDLSSAVFSLELDVQWGAGLYGDRFDQMFGHMSVLEFTFPEAPYSPATNLSWFVEPYLKCSYEIEQSTVLVPSGQTYSAPEIWFDVFFLEDPAESYSLEAFPESVAVLGALELAMKAQPQQGANDYFLQGTASGVMLEADDEWSGAMTVFPGAEAKLYLALSVLMWGHYQGDRMELGVREPGSAPDLCTLEFGGNSYYTMRPVVASE